MIHVYSRLGFLLLAVIFAQFAHAHEVRPSIFTLKLATDRSFTLTADTNVEALIAGIGAEHEDTDDAPTAQIYKQLRELSADELKTRFSEFAPRWISEIGLTFDGSPVPILVKSTQIPAVGDLETARDSIVQLSGIIPPQADTFRWSYPEKFGSSVLRIERPDQELQAQFFGAGARSEAFDIGVAEPRGWAAKALDYGLIGFTHILPKGLDHILFVLGLFLLNTNWRPLLVQVTAFTLAHSVTLAMGLYGVVNLSPAIVEPLIALSIVYVAVENIFTNRLHAWRPVVVFLFGLLHGLGFAGILTEIGLPRSDFLLGLVAFNVGVEFGQLTVIALAFLVVGWFVGTSWYRSRITIPASIAIAVMGAWWFIERTML
ncbi:MAG: HupE/UreJ family protein [Rhizobiaceae bacterium]|nr:HupE/UreJ family protein [Rhizobiaceae bacterium]